MSVLHANAEVACVCLVEVSSWLKELRYKPSELVSSLIAPKFLTSPRLPALPWFDKNHPV